MERRCALGGLGVDIGALGNQQLNQVFLAVNSSHVKRCPSLRVSGVYDCAFFDQGLGWVLAAFLCGHMKGRPALFAARVHVRTSIEKYPLPSVHYLSIIQSGDPMPKDFKSAQMINVRLFVMSLRTKDPSYNIDSRMRPRLS